MPTLVIVTGPPGSGKTTIARRLASGAGLPMLSKDAIKVVLYETLGWGGVERDRELGAATYELMWHIADALLAAGAALLLEANFRRDHEPALRSLIDRHQPRVVQLHCSAPVDVMRERVRTRERHPGHADEAHLELGALFDLSPPLDLPGERVVLDTADVAAIDHDALTQAVTSVTDVS